MTLFDRQDTIAQVIQADREVPRILEDLEQMVQAIGGPKTLQMVDLVIEAATEGSDV